MRKLEALRVEWGAPLPTTSAARCRFWNDKAGGSPSSQHLLGNAADFNFASAEDAARFGAMAEKFGFAGIGLGRRLVHIDDREKLARWTYDDR